MKIFDTYIILMPSLMKLGMSRFRNSKLVLLSIVLVAFAHRGVSQEEVPKQRWAKLNASELKTIGIVSDSDAITCVYGAPGNHRVELKITREYLKKNFLILNYLEPSDARNQNINYLYYITNTDSLVGFENVFAYQNSNKQNPLFRNNMMRKHLVPVYVNFNSDASVAEGLLFWFVPTKNFLDLLPEKENIQVTYIPDSLVKSELALDMTDQELKELGFVFSGNEISFETFHPVIPLVTRSEKLVKWVYNSSGSEVQAISGEALNSMKKSFKKAIFNPFSAGYFIVHIMDADGNVYYSMPKYDGPVLPVYIENSGRSFGIHKDFVVYISFNKSLATKIQEWSGFWYEPEKYITRINIEH